MSFFQNSGKPEQKRGNPGWVRWWKNRLRGLLLQVRLGQVRKAIVESWKSEALRPPIHSLACFGWKFEKMVFERTTSSPLNNVFLYPIFVQVRIRMLKAKQQHSMEVMTLADHLKYGDISEMDNRSISDWLANVLTVAATSTFFVTSLGINRTNPSAFTKVRLG